MLGIYASFVPSRFRVNLVSLTNMAEAWTISGEGSTRRVEAIAGQARNRNAAAGATMFQWLGTKGHDGIAPALVKGAG